MFKRNQNKVRSYNLQYSRSLAEPDHIFNPTQLNFKIAGDREFTSI